MTTMMMRKLSYVSQRIRWFQKCEMKTYFKPVTETGVGIVPNCIKLLQIGTELHRYILNVITLYDTV
jgi:hypothetical protein